MAGEGINRILLSFFFFILLMECSYSKTLDKLLQGQLLQDGDELVSALGTFRLGFFSPHASTNRYLGIWYFMPTEGTEIYYHSADGYYQKNKPVWVANRATPILDKSGKLVIDSTDGNLKILHDGGRPITISSIQGRSNTSAALQQSGNLVLDEINSNGSLRRMLWQSFDFPTDTLLPGMKLGINLQTGHEWFLQSWIDNGSPAPGPFTLRLDPNVTKLLIRSRQGGEVYWTSEVWQNDHQHYNLSSGWSLLDEYYNFSYTSTKQEIYFNYSVTGDAFPILEINRDGGLTNSNGSFISCTKYGGCWKEKQQAVSCRSRSSEDYVWLARRGLMSAAGFKFNQSDNMNYTDCEAECFKNCSCIAFAPTARNFTGCELWSNETEYIKNFTQDAQFIFILDQLPDSEENEKIKKSPPWLIIEVVGPLLVTFLTCLSYLLRRKYREKEEKWWMSIIFAIGMGLVIPLLCYLCYWMGRKLKGKVQRIRNRKKLLRELASTISNHTRKRKRKKSVCHEFKIFDFQTIEAATNNFSAANKIGEGGFGPVYKGKLVDGLEIAIKKLSRRSRQGIKELKNEVKLIAKLQHTNLVRLFGSSLHGEERVLVYEYMPNKSLDFFIFDSERKKLLNWKKRFSIIEGIAQGLLYLHKYSRLKVIHRDLKANNILLDDQMNPKISDFGLAKIFRINESEANTKRIVGTYGYMPPEYLMSGIVSTKTDVFSFGVLVLEIVSSKKNTCSYNPQRSLNLIGYAWQLWNEDRALELVDSELDGSSSPGEVLRCIQVGLLCVQDKVTDRPTMSDVVSMLTNETRLLPAPKQPAFYVNVNPAEAEVPENESEKFSVNEVTITVIVGR